MTEAHRSTVAVTQITMLCLGTLRLEGVSTKHFAGFFRKRKIIGRANRRRDWSKKTTIKAMQYRNSIDDCDLPIFIAAKLVKTTSHHKIIEGKVVQCVTERSEHKYKRETCPFSHRQLKSSACRWACTTWRIRRGPFIEPTFQMCVQMFGDIYCMTRLILPSSLYSPDWNHHHSARSWRT